MLSVRMAKGKSECKQRMGGYWLPCIACGRRVVKVGLRHFVTHADKGFCLLRRLGTWEREILIGFIIWLFLACENNRFSSLFFAGDVSRGGTSASQ